MSTYRMSDDTIVKTENATHYWEESTRWDGSNQISVATGSQWMHETLYRSRKGRYYVEHTSNYQSSTPHAEWVSNEEAARWLMQCELDLPKDLSQFEDSLCE